MRMRAYVRAVVVVATPVLVAMAGCSSSSQGVGGTCSSVCAAEPQCPGAPSEGDCTEQCQVTEMACAKSGNAATFQSFINCEVLATFTCSSTGPTTSDCEPQSVALAACASAPVDSGAPPTDGGSGNSTCASVCAKEPTCSGVPASSCVEECESLQAQCTTAGASTAFQSFLDCAATAKVTCGSNGPTTTGCTEQSAALAACSPKGDSGTSFPDTSFPDTSFRDANEPFDTGFTDTTSPPPADGGPPACFAATAFTAIPWAPPTAAQLTTYENALMALSGSMPTVTSGSTTCDACLQTDIAAAAAGPVVTMSGSPIELNFGGCIANVDGSKAAGSCGNTANNENDCIDQECSSCSDFSATTDPITSACIQAAFATGGPCAGAANNPTSACQTETMGSADMVCLTLSSLLTTWCGM